MSIMVNNNVSGCFPISMGTLDWKGPPGSTERCSSAFTH